MLTGVENESDRARIQLMKTSILMHRYGYAAGSEGNVSLRVDEDEILIKASGSVFRKITPDDFVFVNAKGGFPQSDDELSLKAGPSTELPLHLAVYKTRPTDVMAIIHSHPSPTITLPRNIRELKMVEPSKDIEEIPIISDKHKPGTESLAEAVASAFNNLKVKAVILQGHGLVTVGMTLDEAFDLTQVVVKNASQWQTMYMLKILSEIANGIKETRQIVRGSRS